MVVSMASWVPEERQPVSNDLQPARVCCIGLGEVQIANHDLLRDRYEQSPSPERTPSFPRPQPERKLHSGGHKRRVEGHTGGNARSREEGDGGGAIG